MYKKIISAIIATLLITGCSHTSTPVKKPTIPEVTLPSVYDEYETETNSEGEIVVIVPSTDENGSIEYITEIATDEAGENITVPPTTESNEEETQPSTENQTTEPVTEPSGEDMTEPQTTKPATKPTEPTTSKKEDDTTKPTSKPTNAPTTEPQTTKPTQPPTTEPETTKPVVPPTTEPQTTVPPTTEAPLPDGVKIIKTTDADYGKYNDGVKQWVESQYNFTVYTNGEWVYFIHPNGNVFMLLQYLGSEKTVTVPTSINGEPVHYLYSTFEGNTIVEHVIIPASSTYTLFIGTFKNATALKTVTIGHQSYPTPDYSLIHYSAFWGDRGLGEENTIYVYCDESLIKEFWYSSNKPYLCDNVTLVISMDDGRTVYYHPDYYNCNHEYHLYE